MTSFKESTRAKLITASKAYNKLTNRIFSISSEHFRFQSEYLLKFYKDNFLHLTGIETDLKAGDFFEKCLNESISIEDFDCDSNSALKGKVREKLKNLLLLDGFFNRELVMQESFEKNRVKCKIATSDGKFTLGFVAISKKIHVPLTLLNKNQISEGTAIRDYSIKVLWLLLKLFLVTAKQKQQIKAKQSAVFIYVQPVWNKNLFIYKNKPYIIFAWGN